MERCDFYVNLTTGIHGRDERFLKSARPKMTDFLEEFDIKDLELAPLLVLLLSAVFDTFRTL